MRAPGDNTGYGLQHTASDRRRPLCLPHDGRHSKLLRSDQFGLRKAQPGGASHCRSVLQSRNGVGPAPERFGILTMTGARYLIVNADDFGRSAGVNRGIIRAHQHGIVTSASLMVRWPAAAAAAEYARRHSRLSVGLHLDLGEWVYGSSNWTVLYQVVALDDLFTVR